MAPRLSLSLHSPAPALSARDAGRAVFVQVTPVASDWPTVPGIKLVHNRKYSHFPVDCWALPFFLSV